MKSALLAITLFLAFTLNGFSQLSLPGIQADPATTAMDITTLSDVSLDANQLVINQPVLIKVPIFNHNQPNAVPGGSIFVKIGLGSKIVVDPTFDIVTAPLSNYFSWTWVENGGQVEIYGNLIAPLPSGFAGMAIFRVIPNVLLNSTVTDNVLITNHSTTTYYLSDEDPLNNNAELQYTVVSSAGPVPVTFTNLKLSKKGCNINVNFFTENEINVSHYEIETSKDGINFVKVGTVTAANRISYMKDFALTQELKGTTILVRVKSVDLDGSFKYSETKSIGGLCDASLEYNIYPNPVTSTTLTVLATSGLFDGKYKMVVVDMRGRLIRTEEVELNKVTQYNFELGGIAAGKYILRIANVDGSDTRALPFEKF